MTVEHIQAALLIVGTAAVLVLLGVHGWQRTAPAGPRLGRVERRRARSMRAHARDLALGPAQLAPTLTGLPAFDDDRDDAVPVDMAALMVEQDIEIGREFVRYVEEMVALETAVSFGFIRLEGASR